MKAAILFIGTNDVGFASDATYGAMLDGYRQVVEACHAQGVAVYAATITPLKNSGYDTEYHRQVLKALNDHLRSGASVFDGVLEFYGAVEDPEAPEAVKPEYDCSWGDHLHLGVKGYEKLAETAYSFLRARM